MLPTADLGIPGKKRESNGKPEEYIPDNPERGIRKALEGGGRMNEQEAIEQLQNEYLVSLTGRDGVASVRYHNEALDTAIAALKEVQEYHATGRTPDMVRGLIGGYNRARKQCQEATSQLKQYAETGTPEQFQEAVERTRWIPVSERMPEGIDVCNYIVSIENYGVDIATYVPSVKEWYCLGLPCKAIAWMPLPEPYRITIHGKKEESNEQK